jgi:hypothetical protein
VYPIMFPKASCNIISPPQSFRMLFHPSRPLSLITPSTLGLETFTAFSRSPKRPRNIQGRQASFKDFPVRDFVSRAFLVPYLHLVLVGALEERHRDHMLAGDPMLIEVTLQGQFSNNTAPDEETRKKSSHKRLRTRILNITVSAAASWIST